ncbi:MAG: sodium/proline symporter [Agarilytica sp.]
MVVSFILFLLLFVAIGVSSLFKSQGSKQDYYLASSSVSPWLVGLSAVATNNSGYMFIGVIGYTYLTGLASIWLMVGWILGDFVASLFIHRNLRVATGRSGEVSYAGVLSSWQGSNFQTLQRVIGAVSLIFLLAYASAQLVAGGKALHVLFSWPQWSGAVLGAVMVALYCFAGGIRASIWTDAAQSFVMLAAMALLLFIAVMHLGGPAQIIYEWKQVDGFLNLFPNELLFPGLAGAIAFAISWMVAGFSVIGQPHIMVRFMALSDSRLMFMAKLSYYLWFSVFYGMATVVGMLARIYFSDTASFDAELALPTMAVELLPGVLAGLVLAGIFAATMSTADSLVLSCSAAITHDLLPHKVESTWLVKLVTVGVVLLTLALALSNNESVFNMVILAWSGLGSAFSPLLIFLCLGKQVREKDAVISLVIGFSVSLMWRWLGLQQHVYEGLPAISLALIYLSIATRFKNSDAL